MGTSVTGRFVLDSGDLSSLTSLRLIVTDENSLFREPLNTADATQSSTARADQVQADGTFSVTIDSGIVNASSTSPRTLTLTVYTSCFRKLSSQAQAENSSGTTDFGSVALRKAEVFGYTVTLGNAVPLQNLPVREGNVVRPLIDGEDAWSYLCDKMNAATKSVYMMELAFDTPVSNSSTPGTESPEVVLKFETPYKPWTGEPLTFQPPTIADSARPEQILMNLSDKNKLDVRVMLSGAPQSHTTGVIALFLAVAGIAALGHTELAVISVTCIMLFVLLSSLAMKYFQGFADSVNSLLVGFSSGSKGIETYLKAYKSAVDFQRFPIPLGQWVHSKMVIVDDTEAIVLGSPLHQSYWDTHDHYIYEPRRGSANDEPIPVHDISMAVRGPTVSDMSDAYRLHYNVANPDKKLGPNNAPSKIDSPNAGEYPAALQMVRTLNAKLFDDLASDTDKPYFDSTGEQGVLEAYLRAIENATDYIYLENQYFVNKTIAKALVAALNDTNPSRAKLQIIVVINVTADAPFYPFWQHRLIKQILSDAIAHKDRIGFFTTWSHNAPMSGDITYQNMTLISANYLHSKFGIVDGKWLTIGSGNLDGLSLETSDYLGFLPGQDRRDHEVNLCIFNGIDGASQTVAIEKFRQNLWAEHLGFLNGDGTLNPDADELAQTKGDWLTLFRTRAGDKAKALAADSTVIDPTKGRILEYPPNTVGQFHLFFGQGGGKAERDFLEKTNVDWSDLQLVSKVEAYDFLKKQWT